MAEKEAEAVYSCSSLESHIVIVPPPAPFNFKNKSIGKGSRTSFRFIEDGSLCIYIRPSATSESQPLLMPVKIYPEDVISMDRSCFGMESELAKLIVEVAVIHKGSRTRFSLHFNLPISKMDKFEADFHEFLQTACGPPHRPLPEHRRRVLVLLNPFSGQRKALELWRRDVEPLWREAKISIEMVMTEGPGHATKLAQIVNCDRIGMLALGSGDGLVSEVIQGLMSRNDVESALRLPILHLPMGTGNALAASVCYQANEPFPPRGSFSHQMALMALRPVYKRLRLYRAEFNWAPTKHMFLSLSWGLMADIDIGSERFRCLGMARLHLEAFIRVLRLPSVARYQAKISYLPIQEGYDAPKGEELNQFMQKMRFEVDVEREKFGPTHFMDGELLENDDCNNNDKTNQQIELPPLSEPVPSNWVVMEGEFCFVTVSALSHVGSDLPYLPSCRLHDQFLYLTFVQWPKLYNRLHMAKILLSIDTSAHLADQVFEIIPCLACRIEPVDGAGGMLALDGEAIQMPEQISDADEKGPPMAFQVGSTHYCATVVSRLERRSEIKENYGH